MEGLVAPAAPAKQKRPELLRRLGVLGLIGAVVVLTKDVSGVPQIVRDVFFWLIIFVPLVYVAYVVLKTRDLLLEPELLHPMDLWLCRYSGPLALAPGVAMMSYVIVMVTLGLEDSDGPMSLKGEVTFQAIYFLMEVGFVLALVCVMCGNDFRRARPAWLWKTVSIPLVLIYGLYVFLMPFGTLMSAIFPPDA